MHAVAGPGPEPRTECTRFAPRLRVLPAMTSEDVTLRLPDLTALADEHPDEQDLLRALAALLREVDALSEEARRMRGYAALRLRQKGWTMRAIASVAGVTDSYLAREVFRMGAARRRQRREPGDAPGA